MLKEIICIVVFMLGMCCNDITMMIVCMVTSVVMWPRNNKH